jgi:lipooligosaccharide transport system ATP-binding protein
VSAVSPLIRARGLVKRFGSFTAVDGSTSTSLRGEAFGFLAERRWQVLHHADDRLRVTAERGEVHPGPDPVKDGREIRARLGVVPQDDTLDVERPSARTCSSTGATGLPRDVIRERTARLLEFVQLSDGRRSVDPCRAG